MKNEGIPRSQLLQIASNAFGTVETNLLEEAILREVDIAEDEKGFLLEVGLPKEELLGWDFNTACYGLRTLAHVAASAGKSGFEQDYRPVLAEGLDIVVCIDLASERNVVAIDMDEKEEPQFINSGMPEFLACLAAFLESEMLAKKQVEPESSESVLYLRDRVGDLDPKCLESPDHWWPQVISNIDYGAVYRS